MSVLILLSLFSIASGEVTLSLPLEGHYRAGRYMPVRIRAQGEHGTIRLAAHGAVPTEIESAGDLDLVVPWLALSEAMRDPAWESGTSGKHAVELPLKALADDEKLVAFAGEESDIGQQLFPGKKIVSVSLDVTRPLLQPAVAWQSLDAIVLTQGMAARIADRIADLIASGAVLAVHSPTVPDSRWPWKKIGDYWVLGFEPEGPTSALNADAYSPTYSWERGWPATFRRQVVFAAILFCILGTAILLWRSKWAVAAFFAVSILAAGVVVWWYSRQSKILELNAGMLVRNHSITQYDAWTWDASVVPAEATFVSSGISDPVFATFRQAEQLQVVLVCRADGSPSQIHFHLNPGQSQAFLTRQVANGSMKAAELQPATDPFDRFANDLYALPGDRLAGQTQWGLPDHGPAWPVIVIDASR